MDVTVFVISKNGERLMPTTNIRKIRKRLKNGKAVIVKHEPFTVQLTYETTTYTQPIEFKEDAGYQYVGISVCSKKHEFVSEERKLLSDEKERHQTQLRYRRSRRSRKRYRRPKNKRQLNNSVEKGWLAPSLQHKADIHVALFDRYNAVCPITKAIIEVAEFDTQALKAIKGGNPLPQGKDYQFGERYGYETLKAAVLARQGHKCLICGAKDVPLFIHHIGYRTGDRSNRLGNLAAVCGKCHAPKQHKEDGVLRNLKPMSDAMRAETFMNAVKWTVYESIKSFGVETNLTYGTITKIKRKRKNISKTHANDAYVMGEYRPRHRCHTEYYEKRRRNNRILEKFYDAKYVDIRDSKVKKASELGCNRTSRSTPRNNNDNDRMYRGEKKSKGRRQIRKTRYAIQPGAILTLVDKTLVKAKGIHCRGTRVLCENGKSISLKDVLSYTHVNGWIRN